MRFWLSLPLILLAHAALAQPTVRVSANASVERPVITLGQIAAFDGVAPQLVASLSALEFGPAAGAGGHRELAGTVLRERVTALAPELIVEVGDSVKVHSAYREIEPDYVKRRVEQALERRMPWPAEAVKTVDWRLPESFKVPARQLGLRVHFRAGEDFMGRVGIEVEFYDNDASGFAPVRRSASVELRVKLPVAVSATALPRGAVLDDESLRMESRDLRTLPSGVITDPTSALGQRLARSLPEGTPLMQGHLQSEPLVKRGDVVRVEAGAAGLELSIDARALEKGGLSQLIQLENPATRRRFGAQIIGPGRARLTEPGVGAR